MLVDGHGFAIFQTREDALRSLDVAISMTSHLSFDLPCLLALTYVCSEQDSNRTTKSSRQKSVSFTPDTKANDGFSGQKLSKQWFAGDLGGEQQTDPTEQQPQEDPSVSKKELKRLKKQARRSTDGVESRDNAGGVTPAAKPGKREVPDYVRYLEQFHKDKTNWKFNKNKQKELLKHLLNVWRIPSEHDEALVAYIGGLQGANAQQRVLEEAEAVLKRLLEKQERSEELEGMDSSISRRAAYEAALRREIEKVERVGRSEHDAQQLLEMRREMEKAKRADAILAELLTKDLGQPAAPTPASRPVASERPTVDGESKNAKTDGGAPGTDKRRRKRKARTEVSSDESSSDSSSSDSDSD